MWDVDDPERFAAAVANHHTVSSRVEVWVGGVLAAESAPFIDGDVTDTWVTAGIRRTLDLTVPPTSQWLHWFQQSLVEIRPYRGIRLSRSETVECPLGRFPVMGPQLSFPLSAVKVSADDYYQRVDQRSFARLQKMRTGKAVDAVSYLMVLRPVVVTSDSAAIAKGVTLDKGRHEAIVDYAKSYSLEAFVDREGRATVADAVALGAAQSEALIGDGCTAESFTQTPEWDKVFNIVAVSSSAQDVEFPAQIATLGDPHHPAAPWRIGDRVLVYSSPLVLTKADALKAARNILRKVTGLARSYQYTCIPDPRRDAGDSILGATVTGTEVSQIKTVTHPLTVDGRQQITTVSTQQDYTL